MQSIHAACLIFLLACKSSGGDDTDTGGGDDTGDTGDTYDDTADDTGDSDDTDTDGDTSDTGAIDTGDTADTTPPEVLSITPADQEADVELGATIVITFTEPVLQTSLGAASVLLIGPYGGVGRSLAVSPSSVTVTPFLELTEFGTLYSIELTDVIVDLAGNHLVPVTFEFTTVPTDPRYRYTLLPLDLLNTTAPVVNVLGLSDQATDHCVTEVRDDADLSQQWVFAPSGDWFTLANRSATAPVPNSLDGDVAPTDCFAADATSLTTGMQWQLVADGACTQAGGSRTCPSGTVDHNGVWRLQNLEHGGARSLAVTGSYIGMDTTADSDGQRFLVLRNCSGGCTP